MTKSWVGKHDPKPGEGDEGSALKPSTGSSIWEGAAAFRLLNSYGEHDWAFRPGLTFLCSRAALRTVYRSSCSSGIHDDCCDDLSFDDAEAFPFRRPTNDFKSP
jgi:hypothetical protein